MRNEYIGTSIDGDARAACNGRNQGCGGNASYARQTRTCGCENHPQPHNDCGCEHSQNARECQCNTRQTRECECSNHQPRECECNARQSRDCECGCRKLCENECAAPARRNCPDQTPAMVYAAHHGLENIYGCERALMRGTLFGCLDKPMCNERCSENPCFTQCQADKFTIWELRLYLNTHPCDQQAQALLRKLMAQMDDDCTCAFTPDCSRWNWPDGPWPWEYQHCCGKEA